MKGILTLRKLTIAVTICMAVLCLPGYSEPTPEQVKERTELLIEAVKHNNAEQAKVCIRLGADVNATFSYQYDRYANYIGVYNTLLTYAVEYYCKDITKLLIESGADVNVTTATYKGITVLMRAASREDWKDITELLIKSGADVNAKADDGWTALMYAAGHKDTAELLIKAGADVNAKNNDGTTAFMCAMNKDVAELLIKSGADVNAKDKYGETALMSMARAGSKDTVKLLIKLGADVTTKTNDGQTALMAAAFSYSSFSEDTPRDIDYKDVAELLIKSGADNGTALIWAIKESRSDAVELLIKAGADVNATDSEGISVLTHAILYGQNDIANLLRAAGAKE